MPQLFRSATASPTIGSSNRPAQGSILPPPRSATLSSTSTRKSSLLSQEQTIDDTDSQSTGAERQDDSVQDSITTSGLSTDEDREADPLLNPLKPPKKSKSQNGHHDLEGEMTMKEMEELAKVYGSVVQKLKEMNETIANIAQIKKEAQEVLSYQKDVEERDVREIANQLDMMEEYRKELGTIEGLKGQVTLQSKKVQQCQERLRNVQFKMDSVKQNEILWKQRQSRRLRILWGIAFAFLVIWFLLAMPGRTDLEIVQEPPVLSKVVKEAKTHRHDITLSIFTSRSLEDTPEIGGDDGLDEDR